MKLIVESIYSSFHSEFKIFELLHSVPIWVTSARSIIFGFEQMMNSFVGSADIPNTCEYTCRIYEKAGPQLLYALLRRRVRLPVYGSLVCNHRLSKWGQSILCILGRGAILPQSKIAYNRKNMFIKLTVCHFS